MTDVLSEKSEREYPKSVTELLRLDEEKFVQGVSYFINKISKLIKKNKKKKVKVKVSLCSTVKHYAMKVYEGVDV
jgi:hypothetical protein